MNKETNTILICDRHEKQVPLISTMAFRGAELWCPFCGMTDDIFGGKHIESTPEMESSKKAWVEKSRSYLGAISSRSCSSLMWEGKRISPQELPEEEKTRNQNIINSYVYEGA